MKRFCFRLLFLTLAVCVVPSYVMGADNVSVWGSGSHYMTFKPGAYFPQSGDLSGFKTGFNGEVAIGQRYNENFAAELGVGFFHTDNSFKNSGSVQGLNFSTEEKDTIDVIPIILTFKGIIPVGKFDLYGLGGIGVYHVSAEVKSNVTAGGLSVENSTSDTNTIFGVHAGLGFHFNITPRMFLGAEGKYLWTSETDLKNTVNGVPVGAKFNLNGVLATAIVGFYF
jgi:opacity protein-like surface antigen